MTVHYYMGTIGGGRFAKTACRPDGFKAVVATDTRWNEITCKACRKALRGRDASASAKVAIAKQGAGR